ncbi:hypothetical protein EV2_036824 [Malus domestica]
MIIRKNRYFNMLCMTDLCIKLLRRLGCGSRNLYLTILLEQLLEIGTSNLTAVEVPESVVGACFLLGPATRT